MKNASMLSPSNRLVRDLVHVVGGVMLLCAASKVYIPLKLVPITLQPTAVLLLALTYSRQHALWSVLAWLSLGFLNLPVFADWKPGLVALTGPTAGYIYSYLLVATVIPYLRERLGTQGWLSDLFLATIATVLNFALGITWLATFIGFQQSITVGLLPFILPGIIKAVALCSALKAVRTYRQAA